MTSSAAGRYAYCFIEKLSMSKTTVNLRASAPCSLLCSNAIFMYAVEWNILALTLTNDIHLISPSSDLIVFLMMSRFGAQCKSPQMSIPANGMKMIGEPSLSKPVVPCGYASLKTAGVSHDSMSSTFHFSRHFIDCEYSLQDQKAALNLCLPHAAFSQHFRDSTGVPLTTLIKNDRRALVLKYLTLTDETAGEKGRDKMNVRKIKNLTET